MSAIKFREHTDGIIAALEEAGLTVGDNEAPDDAGPQQDGSFVPYVVVYAIPGGGRSGNLDDPYGDGELVYQVTCVGSSRRQAQWLADKVDVTLLAGITVEGRAVVVIPHQNPGAPREDSRTPPIFSATPRYRLKTTPS